MSSSADGDRRRKCGAAIDGKPWLFVVGSALATLGALPFSPGPVCARCKGSYNFVGLIMLVASLAVVFVLVVV